MPDPTTTDTRPSSPGAADTDTSAGTWDPQQIADAIKDLDYDKFKKKYLKIFVMLVCFLLLYLFFYYLLVNTGKIEKYLGEIIPFSPDKMDRFSKELEAQTKSNALGIPLLAICQGLFASLGYWIFGIPEPFFWGLMTGFFSLLPMVGSALIWVPAGLYKLSEGSNWQGIAIILYGILVIGMVDNVFRLVFQKKFADIHPMVTILGVIIGLQLFGVPGLIFGPLLIGYFILLLKIFKEEFLKI